MSVPADLLAALTDDLNTPLALSEVARIAGYGALPSTPMPEVPRAVGGILTAKQARARNARRALAAAGYAEAVTFSFTSRKTAEL